MRIAEFRVCVPWSRRLCGALWVLLFLVMVACVHAEPTAETGTTGSAPFGTSNVGTNIPVLVVSEDEDPTTVKRSSDIFKRVISELRISMQRHGFRMLDEESLAVDLDWTIADRRSKMELLESIKLMNKSRNASHQVRAWVLFRIHAQAKQLASATKVQTRIDGEIYDAASNQFLDGFEMPREEYPAPADCLQSKLCISEVVGDRAREIAANLGEVLARKLERYSPPQRVTRDVPVDSDRAPTVRRAPSGPGYGLLTPYTLTLRHFGNREALTIVGVMAEEFPGYRSHDLINKSAAIRRYQYLTTAKAFKLEEWLYILLHDMGFDMNQEILIQVEGTDLIVDKLIPTDSRPESADERRRFR